MDVESVSYLDTAAKIAILKNDENEFERFTKDALGAPYDLLKFGIEDKFECIRNSLEKEGSESFARVKEALAMDKLFWCRVENLAQSFCQSQKDSFHKVIAGASRCDMDSVTFDSCCDALKERNINFTRFNFYDFKGKNKLYVQFPSISYCFDNNQVRMYNDRVIRGAIAIDSSVENFSKIRQDLMSFLAERLQDCFIDDCRLSVLPSLRETIGNTTFKSSLSVWNNYKKFLFKQALVLIALKNRQKAKMINRLAFTATSYLKCDETQLSLLSKIALYWKMYDWIEEKLRPEIVSLVPHADREQMFAELNTSVQKRYVESLLAIKKGYNISDRLWKSIIDGAGKLRSYNAFLRAYELPAKDVCGDCKDLKVRVALFLLKRNINPLRFHIKILESNNYMVESPFVQCKYTYGEDGQLFVLGKPFSYVPGTISIPEAVHNAMLEHVVCMIEIDLDQVGCLLIGMEKHFNPSGHSLLMSDGWKRMMVAKIMVPIVLVATRNEEAAIFLENVIKEGSQFSSDDRELLSHIALMWRLKTSA